MCLSFCILSFFVNVFSMYFVELSHAAHVFIFEKHTQASRLSGELTIYPMTIGQGSNA